MRSTLNDRRPAAEICRGRGWGPGTRLVGDEGYGPTVIEILSLENPCACSVVLLVQAAGSAIAGWGDEQFVRWMFLVTAFGLALARLAMWLRSLDEAP